MSASERFSGKQKEIKEGKQYSHPILSVFTEKSEEFERVQAKYTKTIGLHELDSGFNRATFTQHFLSQNFGFFADAVAEKGEFPLEPVDLVAIGRHVVRNFDNLYQRYALFRIIGTAYAVQGTKNPQWKEFPRFVFERNAVPDKLAADTEGIIHVMERLNDTLVSTRVIGVIQSRKEQQAERAEMLGVKVDAAKLDQMKKDVMLLLPDVTERFEALSEIRENLGNGIVPISMILSKTLQSRK